MHFPIAEVSISLWYLFTIGFVVGACGGFMGMGGGWLLIPALSALSTPLNIAVGTSLAQMLGSSIVSTMRHWQFGNVALRLVAIMIPGSIIGVEIGASLVELFKSMGRARMDVTIGAIYVVVLLVVSIFTFFDARGDYLKAKRKAARHPGHSVHEYHTTPLRPLPRRVQTLKLPPCISCPVCGIASISLWAVLLVAIVMGLFTGLLGIGGGLIGLPLLVYIIGCPTHVAVGTIIVTIVISAGYGTLSHALKGNVDLLMAFFLLFGSACGALVGSLATRQVSGIFIRGLFAIAALGAALSLVFNTFLHRQTLALVTLLIVAGLACVVIIYVLVSGITTAHNHKRGSISP